MKTLAAMMFCLATAACGVDLGETAAWRPVADMTGDLAPSFGDAPQRKAAPTDRALRVTTFNIRDGGVDPKEIAKAFLADPDLAQTDVLLLQEAISDPGQASVRTHDLADALGMGWVFAPSRVQDGPIALGEAILSRYPLVDQNVMYLPLAPHKRQRGAVCADVQIGDATLRIIDTHLDTSLNITNRIRQLHPAIVDQPDAVLVGGDFNTNPYAWADGLVPSLPDAQAVDTDQAPALDDYMSAVGFDNYTASMGPTEIRYGIESRLDAVYSRGVVVDRGAVNHSIGEDISDHSAVWIDVRLPLLHN